MADQPTGLFGFGAVPGGTRAQREQQLRDERYNTARQEAYEMNAPRGNNPYSGLYQAANTGFAGNVANMISALENTRFGREKLGMRPGGMSQVESQMYDMQEAGSQAYKDRLESMPQAARDKMSAIDLRMMQMDSMARAAYEAGDMQTYAKLLDGMHQTAQADRLNEAKIRELEGQSAGGDQWSFDRIRKWWPSGQREQYQQTYLAANKGIDTVSSLVDLVEEVGGRGQDPDILTRDPGTAIQALGRVNNIVRTGLNEARRLMGLAPNDSGMLYANSFTPTNQDTNLDTYATRDDTATKGDVLERADAMVPDHITGEVERARYKAMMIQMAYAAWRQNEGSGSRQASNQDIIMAMDTIGANGNSIDSVLQTVIQSQMNGLQEQRARVIQAQTSGMSIGLDPQFIERAIFGGTMDALDTKMGSLLEKANPYMSPIVPAEGADGRAAFADENRWQQQDDGSISYGGATIVFD